MYYTSLDFFRDEFDKCARSFPVNVSDKDEFLEWQRLARNKLKEIIKLGRIESDNKLKSEILEEVTIEDNIMRQKVVIEVQPKVYMPMYILIPEFCRNNRDASCMIAMSGHQGGGMLSVAGIMYNDDVVNAINKYNYAYGLELAKNGVVAVCPETRGFGLRREMNVQGDENILASSCYHISHMAQSLGFTLLGLQIYDIIRLVDYLYERDEWNVNNLGIMGFSGGGMQALYTSAIDERLKNVFVSGYMYGYKQSLLELNGNCNCNYVDGLWQHFDMGDIGAMISPRRFIIQSGRKDHLNGKGGLDNVYSQVDIVESAYEVLGLSENLKHDVHEGVHTMNMDYFKEHLSFFSM